jgi:hypothetical protein
MLPWGLVTWWQWSIPIYGIIIRLSRLQATLRLGQIQSNKNIKKAMQPLITHPLMTT